MKMAPAAAVAAAVYFAPHASAQSPPEYPAKPVRAIVGQAPGGGNAIQTRLSAQQLSESIRRGYPLANRTGAGSVVSYRTVAAAVTDGYTLLAVTGGFTIAPALHANLGYDSVKDLAPLTLVVQSPFLLLTHPSLPVRNVKELLALAKSRP